MAKRRRKKAGRKAGRQAKAGRGGGNRYSDAFQREVAEFSILNGIIKAAQKYKVSSPSVTNWRKKYGITRATKRRAQSGLSVAVRPGTRGAAKRGGARSRAVARAGRAASASRGGRVTNAEVETLKGKLAEAYMELDRIMKRLTV